MDESCDQLWTSDEFYDTENRRARARVDQKVGNNDEGTSGNSRHHIRDHRGQVMIFVQSPERPVKQETMNQVVKESAYAESNREHRNRPPCVRCGRL